MRTSKWILGMGAAALALSAGCGKDDTPASPGVSLKIQGTTPVEAAGSARYDLMAMALDPLALAATSANASVDVKDSNGSVAGTLTITDARIALKEIKLKLAGTEDDSAEEEADDPEFTGPYVVDLLTDTVTPSLATLSFPAGTYKEIELKLDKIEGSEDDEAGTPIVEESDPLFGNSIYVEGTYTGNTAGGPVTDAPFRMSFELDEEFKLTGPNDTSEGFALTDGASVAVVIAFRLGSWIVFDHPTNEDGVDFSQVVLTGSDIVLDEDASGVNSKIREVIKENIKESADYGEDKDGDGELEDDEDDDDAEEDEAEDEDGA